jgi:hypothetical protein
MSKRGWIIFGIIVLASAIGFAVATYFISNNRQKQTLVSPENKTSTLTPLAVPSQANDSERVYEDSAGFSFSYPGDLTVSDQTPDDNKHYSLLYIKNQTGETSKITVKDVAYSTGDKWSSAEKEVPAGTKPVKTLTLSGLKADYYETAAKIVTVAVSQNILYEIVSPNTPGWQKIHPALSSSFSIGSVPAGNRQSASPPADNTTYEPEQVVE